MVDLRPRGGGRRDWRILGDEPGPVLMILAVLG
jgi:hypothetical protein